MKQTRTIKKKILVLSLALLFFLVAPMLAMNVHATDTATGTVFGCQDGSNGATTTWTISSPTIGTTTVKVDIYITGAANIWGFGVNSITWNPAVLQIGTTALTKAKLGTYFNDIISTYGDSFNFLGSNPAQYDNGKGQVNGGMAVSDSSVSNSADDVDTSGSLIVMTFTVVGYGTCNINFGGGSLYDQSGDTPVAVTIPGVTITVGAPSTATTLTLNPISAIQDGVATTISGVLSNNDAPLSGQTIVIWTDYVDNTPTLHTASVTVTTGSDGSYSYSWTPSAAYNYEVIVQFAGDSTNNIASETYQTVILSQFVSPEYAWGALLALAAAFVAFISFAAAKKIIHVPSFSKRI